MVCPQAVPGVVMPVHPVAVQLAGFGLLQVPVPYVGVNLRQLEPGLGPGRVEEAQFDRLRAVRENGEVRTRPVPGRSERIGVTGAERCWHERSGYR